MRTPCDLWVHEILRNPETASKTPFAAEGVKIQAEAVNLLASRLEMFLGTVSESLPAKMDHGRKTLMERDVAKFQEEQNIYAPVGSEFNI